MEGKQEQPEQRGRGIGAGSLSPRSEPIEELRNDKSRCELRDTYESEVRRSEGTITTTDLVDFVGEFDGGREELG